MNQFFASLPRGKEDKPLLFAMGPLVYDFHDIDGLYYMLDQKLGGCLLMMWAKPMDPAFEGRVTLDGQEVRGSVLQPMAVVGGMWILGIPLRGLVREYGREYALHVEGYRDTDGNEMSPQDFTVKAVDRSEPDPTFSEHEKIALQAAREGIVLLKNDKALPLKSGSTLNLFGRGIHEFRISAVGAGKINPRRCVDLVEAARESEDVTLNEELVAFYACDQDRIPDEEILQRARKASGTAVVLLTRAAGENQDTSTAKGEYYLTDDEDRLLKKVSELFSHTIVVMNVGYPISLSFMEKYRIDALLYLGYAGMLAGPALLDVLTGAENPSGKLPDSWAWDYFDIPASRNFYDCANKPRLTAESTEYVDTVYEEDIYVGYRYFSTFEKKLAYPFGFGLSYSFFMLEPSHMRWDGKKLTLNIFIKNMGKRPGKEVVQVYVGKPDSDLEKPVKELVFFEKTRLLAPGDVQEIAVSIPAEHLVSYSEKLAAYVLDAGEYKIYVGNSSEAKGYKSFDVPERQIVRQVKNRMQPNMDFVRLSKFAPKESFPKGEKSGVVTGKNSFRPYARRGSFEARFAGKEGAEKLTFADVKRDNSKLNAFVSQLSVPELARLCVCASAGWGMEGIGEAGSMFQIEGLDIPKFPVSDGNSGVNVNVKNIGMPSGVTLCASFNKELCEDVGRVIGQEAKALGVPMILAPALNIHRNPLNGRQPEYFSEDPYLAGLMAGHYSRGLESAGVASCVKHMIGNNCESTRKRNQSVISERAIRELYFRAFQYAMEVHMPASAMTAYNAVNGCPTAADADLMLGLMREENGFDGYFMTDWTTYDTVDVAAMVQAGMSWVTPGSLDETYTAPIVEGVHNGTIALDRLRENVAFMLKTIAKFS